MSMWNELLDLADPNTTWFRPDQPSCDEDGWPDLCLPFPDASMWSYPEVPLPDYVQRDSMVADEMFNGDMEPMDVEMIPLVLPISRPGLKGPSDLNLEDLKLYNEASSNCDYPFLNNCEIMRDENFNSSEFMDALFEESGDLTQYIIGKDCNLSGCNIFCEQQHTVGMCCPEDPLMTIIPTDQLFDYNDVSTADEIEPYTPSNDHCYSAPMKSEPYGQTDRAGGVHSPSAGSSTLTDTEEGEDDEDEEIEVDVVTCDEPLASYTPPSRNTRSRQNPKQAPQPKKSSPQKASCSRISKQSPKGKVAKTKRNTKVATPQVANRLNPNPAYISRQFISQLVSSEDDSQDVDAIESKRREHNKLERKRRMQQRDELQSLRMCIPSLKDNAKAAKVCILQHATDFVRKLRVQERTLSETLIRENQRKRELEARFTALTKGLF